MAKRARAGITASDDRLSALPDGVLHTILSFLPARQLVQTSLLSRRWKDLWCSTPCINIDEREFDIGSGRNVQAKKWSKFENFNTNLLLFRSNAASVDKFCLYAHEHNHRDVDKWIRRGIKRLYLSNVSLDNCFAELLSSGSSPLEILELRSCWNYFWDITSHTLKDLFIDSCIHHDAHPLVITAPGLTSLRLNITNTSYADGISVYQTTALAKAAIVIPSPVFFPVDNQRNLLRSLFSVTKLELGGFETKALLVDEFSEFQKFANMRTLLFGEIFLDEGCLDVKLELLGSFMQNAPCLEKLTLYCSMVKEHCEMEWDSKRRSINLQRQNQKAFQCPKLKVVEVLYEDDHHHRLAEFLWVITARLPHASITLTKLR
ncbi:MEIOTIC F-BOX protein MOF isoform X2 [Lolium perenne]|uniref:MEIOTIC F-BOX protein MOF isoform X2 n=1 Tax=Lolium perenne TaxID=4522 RepID=UPI0021F63639|nr:MEIOTIC F-BOX protein MOF-like isoform X2 [Lolium perenne]